ncbi:MULTISPECIES: nuclear transport factor 2 family protein [Variovorax]|jgi:uncharacterized protein|uniref:nuclear transport factor 2 family protein n=1 Tax=Variovorax TaxID=34072 RepID=UPI00086EB378|nr:MULTISPECIES: nuclear transport factor 2 family protein [Variovorax]MBN8754647.1 nuclear transport factor 2 family protein [Variovorax sp.]ODU19364.1 MAG: hypothetical protein ABS94_00470 [Variovorax sp. SCN 67-85]ODV25266.1 MAG: hypothetical protein ABT25_10810 [Variovorax sp. SCN 67-20]OJZ03085.1 MAG: hypothetical protein BGP22_00465 [Variovorax sp. 67-131]UKI08167.1 nuclear transport factor 2 family protein [Variovorax paradoxus]
MSTEHTRGIVEQLFAKARTGADPDEIASLFDEKVDWLIAGDVATVPWIGRKTGRAGVATFYRQIRELLVSERFEVTGILVDGSRAVVLGSLASRVKRTGKLIETEFVFDMAVHDGLITRYHMLEDSFAVAQALTQG